MTKSTSRRVRCMGCGEEFNAKKLRDHICKTVQRGLSLSEPIKEKSRKLMFGRNR